MTALKTVAHCPRVIKKQDETNMLILTGIILNKIASVGTKDVGHYSGWFIDSQTA